MGKASQPKPPHRSQIILAALLSALPAAAERVAVKLSADTYVYATPFNSNTPEDSEAYDNHGSEAQFVVKGREYFSLLRFDLAAAKGMTVEKATLRFYLNTEARWLLSWMGVSTLSGSGDWGENTANYFFAKTATQPWAYPGSELTDVMFGPGGSLYAFVNSRSVGDQWWEIDIPPALIHALLAGDQYGLVLSCEKGQTGARSSIAGRIQSQRTPTLTLDGERTDTTPPGAARLIEEGFRAVSPGGIALRFGGAGDDIGAGIATRYELRYAKEPVDATNFDQAQPVPRWMLDPTKPKTEPLATANELRDEVTAVVQDLEPSGFYFFAARATDEAGNSGPVSPLGGFLAYAREYPQLAEAPKWDKSPDLSGSSEQVWAAPELVKIHPATGELLERAEYPDHRTRNPVWDDATATVSLSGVRNEFVAFQLAVESDGPLRNLSVTIADPLFGSAGSIQVYREWFVPDENNQWFADALVPIATPYDQTVPGLRAQPLFVDVYIPHDAAPGAHSAKLVVTSDGRPLREIVLRVQVAPIALPDRLNFFVDLNGYGGVSSGYNVRTGTPEYRSLVHAFHRLAHANRANVNVLGYSHSGLSEPDYAPPLTGAGAATRVADWTAWDAHFGPLVSGAAFADLPRAWAPVPSLYLNFHENWPSTMDAYRWNNYPKPATTADYQALIARHGYEAGPIEEGFPADYQARFMAVVSDFAEHFRQRGWLGTRYQVYFNDKHFYKDPAQGGRGVSWWLLDEPNYRDDFRALSFFGDLTRRALRDYPDVPIIFRTDISYSDFMRDLLTGQVDLNCTSKRLFTRNRLLLSDRARYGRELWHYASPNHPRDSNVAMRAWCWQVYLAGGDGVVPWNTLATGTAWTRAEQLTVFYPGSKFGKLDPLASIRLKAFRRGQQDIEYLVLLAQSEGWDREAVTRAVLALPHATDRQMEQLRQRVLHSTLISHTSASIEPSPK